MSLYDYHVSLEISEHRLTFYGLIMAAVRKADSINLHKLQAIWPEVVQEFKRRYHAPGGILPGDNADEGSSGPCSVCQTETAYCGEYDGDSPVWLCPGHGGAL